jgi:DNA-binding MarR family transcriptional regulator
MNNIPNQTVSYINFINSTRDYKLSQSCMSFDFIEEQVLQTVMISWCANTHLTVTDVISTSMKGVSQSTVHRRLRSLRKMSMITHAVDEIDTRIKYVYPTRHCIEYFNTLAACFNHSVTALI